MKTGIIGTLILLVIVLISCQSQDELEFKRYYTTGKVVYQSKCQNCHGDNGQGLSALMPPLTDSVYLQANKHLLPCIIKHGLNKPIIIHGKTYLFKFSILYFCRLISICLMKSKFNELKIDLTGI